MRIAAEVVVDVHIDEVFQFVANPLNDPRWCKKVLYVEQVDGDEPGPGAEYTVVHRRFRCGRLGACATCASTGSRRTGSSGARTTAMT